MVIIWHYRAWQSLEQLDFFARYGDPNKPGTRAFARLPALWPWLMWSHAATTCNTLALALTLVVVSMPAAASSQAAKYGPPYTQLRSLSSPELVPLSKAVRPEFPGQQALQQQLRAGHYQHVQSTLADVLEQITQTYGDDSPLRVPALINLATAYYFAQQYASAADEYSQALAVLQHTGT